MILRLFSDPHIGVNRTSHTTPASRQRLKQALHLQVMNQIVNPGHYDALFCLGDLFDEFEVDNNDLIDGLHISERCRLVLHGNHDISNRADKVSSIEVVDIARTGHTTREDHADGIASTMAVGLPIWWIDHKLTQAVFEEALEDAAGRATEHSILFLHCNYDSPFATQESSLNLTRDKAAALLSVFSHIFIGHEHACRSDFDGRLVVVGNTHPTSFSDISDKFYWDIHVGNGRVEKVTRSKIWDQSERSLVIDWTQLSNLTDLSRLRFIDVVGRAEQQQMAGIAKQVADLWGMSDELLMVRNNVSIVDNQIEPAISESVRCQSVPERISAELSGTRLSGLWEHYLTSL